MKISKKKLKEEIFAFLDKYNLNESPRFTRNIPRDPGYFQATKADIARRKAAPKQPHLEIPNVWVSRETSTGGVVVDFYWVGQNENSLRGPFQDLAFATFLAQQI